MSKRTRPVGDEPTAKRQCRIGEVNQTVQSALYDNGAWEILKQFLTTSMSLSDMDDALIAYLGDRYSEDDWVEPRRLLFSGDDDNLESLRVLTALWKTYIPDPPKETSARRVNKSHKPFRAKNMYILDEAEEGDDEEDEYEEDEYEEDEYVEVDEDRTSVRKPKVTRMPGPSAKQRLTATFDDMANWFEQNSHSSSQSRQGRTQTAPESRMYLLDVQRTVTEYIADHLRRNKFPVTLSAWVAGQLYVVADSPKTIADSLPLSLYIAVKRYSRITDEERGAVERSRTTLPNPAWETVEVLFPTCDFPYPMPQGCRSLVERSRLPQDNSVSDIILDDQVVGWKFKGESYYMGLLLKNFHRDHLELLATPHADDIQLHLESGWDKPFLKKTVVAFSMQFLRAGDHARVIKGALCGELGKVISTDHTCGSVGLEFTFDECPEEIEVRLQDIERVFRLGDTVRVVAGPYLGLEGHVLKMCEDVFHVCQAVSKEVYTGGNLEILPRSASIESHAQFTIASAAIFRASPDSGSIEIGDFIQVLDGEHAGKRGIVDWLSKADTKLWFQDFFTPVDTESGLSSISVPIAMVQRTDLTQTIQYTRERGYDVKPGDVVNVARGPDYGAKGVVQSVDFPNARLTLLCDGDRSLINVQIRFVIKVQNTNLSSFKKDIGQEVFVIGGERKGYRGTLHSFTANNCTVALHGQQRMTFELHEVATKYAMRLTGAMLQGPELVSFCNMRKRSFVSPPPRSVTPPVEMAPTGSSTFITGPGPSSSNGSSISDPWTIDLNDSIDARIEKPGPLPWLMSKDFSSKFFNYHVVLKVSPSFMGGRLNKRFVFTACPDPFCGENGPAPEGCVAAFCTSNSAGAAITHYHIPASDLSPAPPRKKNQHVLILDGDHRGLIQPISSCSTKDSVVKIAITPTVTITLRFDQLCGIELTERSSVSTETYHAIKSFGDVIAGPSAASLVYSFDRRAARYEAIVLIQYPVKIDELRKLVDRNTFLKPALVFTHRVISSKYTIITFLPRNLLEQFIRTANIFFAFIAILQFFPEFSTISPGLVVIPILIVLSITAIKDGYEDIKRHQSDRQVNHSQTHVLTGGDCVNPNMNGKKSRTFASGVIPRQRPEREDVEADAATNQDPDIEYDHMDSMEEEKNQPTIARSYHLPDNLGQIEYIFGQNQHSDTEFYGQELVRETSNDSSHASTSARGDDPAVPPAADAAVDKLSSGVLKHFRVRERLSQDLARPVEAEPDSENATQARSLNGFFSVLALGHTGLTAVDPATGAIEYKAQSPDEAALVQAAAGSSFTDFTSARKLMSVIVKKLDEQDGILFLLTRGMDNVIFERLKAGGDDWKWATETHLEDFANSGLRTLTLAYKDEYVAWSERYHEASTGLDDREGKIEAFCNEMERDLRLLGATAIEDWQDNVPDSNSQESKSGLLPVTSSRLPSVRIYSHFHESVSQIFDATIGRSTNLIAKSSNIIVIRGSDRPVQQQVIQAVEEFFPDSGTLDEHGLVTSASKSPSTEPASAFPMRRLSTGVREIVGDDNGDGPGGFVPIIDGAALDYALTDDDHKALLLQALVVKMVKDGLGVMTLAFGDGANDVIMIQAADVGIGISGEEGLQAVNSSDYAIAQSYARDGIMIVNFFYKNIACIGVVWCFQIYRGWSSFYVFEYTYLLFWNSFWTIAPVLGTVYVNTILGVLITQEVKLGAGLNKEVSLYDRQDSRSDDLPSVLQFRSPKGVITAVIELFATGGE
ncbi:hypothetical protein BD769DRAFT_1746834 [Suillus cothurnatus]|nr:hypothetical protein BD769DRAFT_1746834 [Suillus cothurnatus]